MKKTVDADITPAVLIWARKTIGYEIEEAADKIGVEAGILQEWESGLSKPSFAKLHKISDVYKRPTVTFYLDKPPDDARAPKDFRRLHRGQVGFSRGLRLSLRDTQVRQDFAREVRFDENAPKIGFIRSARLSEDPERVAQQFREKVLNVDIGKQMRWSDALVAFNEWRTAVEAVGPLVFQFSDAPLDEMWGYSFPDPLAPVVVINAKAWYTGRTFTLMHEVGHLLLDADGLCNLTETPNDPAQAKVEVWCNAFAGALLVPKEALFQMVGHVQPMSTLRMEWADDELERMATKFKVSREVIVRRLLTHKLTTQHFYEKKREQLLKEYARMAEEKETKPFPFPPYRKSIRNNGKSFIRLALDAYHQETITSRELSDYLGVKVDQVDKVVGEL